MKNLLKILSIFVIGISISSCNGGFIPQGSCGGGCGQNGQALTGQDVGLLEGDIFYAEIMGANAMNQIPFQGYNGVAGTATSGYGAYSTLTNFYAPSDFPIQNGMIEVTDAYFVNQYSNVMRYAYRVVSVPQGEWKTDPFEMEVGSTTTLAVEQEGGDEENILVEEVEYELVELVYHVFNEAGEVLEEKTTRVLRKQ